MTITKNASRTRKAAAAPRTRKTTTTAKAAEATPKLYRIHSLDEMEIDTRVRRLDPLDRQGARELTDQIRRTQIRLWLLVTEAHDRRAHIALGYETWADYVKAELNMSESRSYQFLDTGHVMKAIASAGVDVDTMSPPPTRVVARVKDRLTDVRKAAEQAVKQSGETDGTEDLERAVDKNVRALAREPRPARRTAAAASESGETTSSTTKKTAAAPRSGDKANGDSETVECPACNGTGRIERSLADLVRDLMRQRRG